MAARELEVPIADEGAPQAAAEEADGGGGGIKEILDVPWINRRTGLDLIVITVLGIVLGLLSVPYCLKFGAWAVHMDVDSWCQLPAR
ncbi:RPS15 [Symbiodinium pilosum]|uniref:RPS15 protein n=1 Tax=Symbiodinium pilosum TaxID=2952 RepID=A0A812MDM8_SYMPI|nr:RPS15 [Symbiodinium pilosum]